MTMQGKIRNCARNALLFSRQNKVGLSHYWITHLKNHLEFMAMAKNKTPLIPSVQRLVDRALALPAVPLQEPPEVIAIVKITPRTYTISDAGISKVADAAAKIVYGMNDQSVGEIAESVRKLVTQEIKQEATCVS
jgi:hypothetical protein